MILHGKEIDFHISEKKDEDLYQHTLNNLKYDEEYSIAVRGLNKNFGYESEAVWVVKKMPRCFDFQVDKSLCGPPTIENLQTNFSSNNGYLLNVLITWNQPDYEPDFYILEIRDMYMIRTDTTYLGFYNYTIDKVRIS